MERTLTRDLKNNIGNEVVVMGWVSARRDHGKIIFLDIRDRWGSVQTVFIPSNEKAYKAAEISRSEFVVKITGTVNERPQNMVNDKIPSGDIELLATDLEIISQSETPPFEIDDTLGINEDIRFKNRFLDLRSQRMLENLKKRHEVSNFIRKWMSDRDFIEIETPILTKSTPEGARDYVVPSRTQQGMFYALPQAPQQYKQLLMVSGIERYFQIARCFRDEDLRGDRQPEFTQLDMEISFTTPEEIQKILEELMISLVESVYPEKKIFSKPFPKITWKESMEKYGSDKPDVRKDKKNPNELAFVWVTDFPLFEYSEKDKVLNPMHHPFTSFVPEDIGLLEKDPTKIRSLSFDLVLNGSELGSGSTRIHDRNTQQKIFEILGISKEEIKNRFGHLLRAFDYGVPPHGGMAWGLDRLLMLLQNERSVREVIAFPKNQEGKDLLMNAPSEIEKQQLKDIHIKIDDK